MYFNPVYGVANTVNIHNLSLGLQNDQCSKPLLVDEWFGNYTTLHILGIRIIQERGIPFQKPTRIKWNDTHMRTMVLVYLPT